jgi:hypothetical protein
MAKYITERKRDKIARLIEDHHLAFIVEALGPDAVSQQVMERLQQQGLLKQDTIEHAQVSVQAAHALGKMGAVTVTDQKLSRMSPQAFWQFVETAPPQFNAHELAAVQASRRFVARAIVNLGRGVAGEFENALHEEDAKLRHETLQGIVQHEIGLGIVRHQTNEQIVRRLKKKCGESERDWRLVVQTELHNAKEHGKALLLSTQGDPLVFKRPRADACRFCKRLFLTGDRPRIFKLSALVKNGSNVGRKHGEFRAVIGAVHPACECELFELPEGFTLDAAGKMVPGKLKKAIPDTLTDDLKQLIGHRCET